MSRRGWEAQSHIEKPGGRTFQARPVSRLRQGRMSRQPAATNGAHAALERKADLVCRLGEFLKHQDFRLQCEQPVEGAREGEVRKENFGEVKVEAGSTVLDEVLGSEGAKFSQEGVTVRLESG